MPNKVLIITYYWPPSGGAGVQRWLKFSKYLPEFGWEPIILTVDPEFAAYPVTDSFLSGELPSSLRVYTTPATDYFTIFNKDRTKIPSAGFANNVDNTFKSKLMRFVRGNFFIPDPRKGWNKYAFNKACDLIESEGIKNIITTSPPHSTQLIGLKIKRKYPSVKWIADLRDPWTDIYYYKQFFPTLISRWYDSRYELSVLTNSDKIITVGESLKKSFSSKAKGIEEKTEIITNGYDASDFEGLEQCLPSRFTLTYVGTLSDVYPVEGLISAMKNLKLEEHDFALRFIGSVSEKQRKLILSEIPCESVEFISYVNHSKAIDYMVRSSVLILIIPSHISNKSIITGKLFEYLATDKPVLCIGPPDGDAAAILKKTGHGIIFSYNDSGGIKDYLSNLISGKSSSGKTSIIEFSRFELTKQLSQLL